MEKNQHLGTSFDTFLKQEGLLEEVTMRALKRVAERQRDVGHGKLARRRTTRVRAHPL